MQVTHEKYVGTARGKLYHATALTQRRAEKSMMPALYILQLVKRHILGQSDEKIKPIALSVVELCLAESIS